MLLIRIHQQTTFLFKQAQIQRTRCCRKHKRQQLSPFFCMQFASFSEHSSEQMKELRYFSTLFNQQCGFDRYQGQNTQNIEKDGKHRFGLKPIIGIFEHLSLCQVFSFSIKFHSVDFVGSDDIDIRFFLKFKYRNT